MVTQTDIEKSLEEIGIKAGDTVLFHSSLKSFGQVDGGASTVISAFLNIVTSEGEYICILIKFSQEKSKMQRKITHLLFW